MQKDTVTAVIGAYTKAEKARRILTDAAIFARTVKVSDKAGCMFGVEFPAVHRAIAVSALNAGRITPRSYLQ